MDLLHFQAGNGTDRVAVSVGQSVSLSGMLWNVVYCGMSTEMVKMLFVVMGRV